MNTEKVALLADDQEMVLRILAQLVPIAVPSISHVETANSPDMALKIANKYNGELKLVISDIDMPYAGEGFKLAKELREGPLGEETPLILSSGGYLKSDPRIKDLINKGYVDDFAPKPLTIDDLTKSFRRAIAMRLQARRFRVER